MPFSLQQLSDAMDSAGITDAAAFFGGVNAILQGYLNADVNSPQKFDALINAQVATIRVAAAGRAVEAVQLANAAAIAAGNTSLQNAQTTQNNAITSSEAADQTLADLFPIT